MTEAARPTPAPPLDGIRVLDMSRILAGPLCGMALGDLGADVIKVENPDGGDDTRHMGNAIAGGERTYFLALNRNKRSIAVDFRMKEGQELLHALARDSDVFLENYKLGGLDKFGLDYETLRRINPRLIYVSISGYGRVGPDAARLGYDYVLQGESGLMSVTGDPDGPPMKTGVPVADVSTGMYATQAVLAALLARQRTGEGQFVDIALFDCLIANLANIGSNGLLLDSIPKRFGNGHADLAPFDTFECSDGSLIITVANEPQFKRMCVALDLPELATDPRFARNELRFRNKAAMNAILEARLRSNTREHWKSRLEAQGVACGEVRNIKEAAAAAERGGRDMVVEIDHPAAGRVKVFGSPLKLRGTPLAKPSPAPLLGQHTDEILSERLGLDPERIAKLREIKAIA